MPLNVHLRPVAEADLPLLERLTADVGEAGPFGFFGYRDLTHIRRDFAENSFLGPNSGRLAVGVGPQVAGSEFVGDVSWPIVDLRVDWIDDDPIGHLDGLWQAYRPQMQDYLTRALNPTAAPSYGVPGNE